MELNKWEHFVNDDCTRSFLSLEVTRTGLPEVFDNTCPSLSLYMHHTIVRVHFAMANLFGVSYSAV